MHFKNAVEMLLLGYSVVFFLLLLLSPFLSSSSFLFFLTFFLIGRVSLRFDASACDCVSLGNVFRCDRLYPCHRIVLHSHVGRGLWQYCREYCKDFLSAYWCKKILLSYLKMFIISKIELIPRYNI